MTLGISANATFAENATTEASSNNDLGDDLVGLRKIEDGSVVSNIHTAKWRVFTDKAREFFQQAGCFFVTKFYYTAWVVEKDCCWLSIICQGKLDEAEKLFLSAIQEAKEGFGEQDPHVASACNNLVILLAIDIVTFLIDYIFDKGVLQEGQRYEYN